METVANVILPEDTISEGGSAPGWTSVELQRKYADTVTRENIEQLAAYREYMRMPYPMVTLNAADQARIAELQKPLATYAEAAMARFVTGDTELTDENWNAFTEKVKSLGLEELISLWQKYVK